MDDSGIYLWVTNLHVWVALRQYTNVCLRLINFHTVVVKGLKKKLVDKCDHALLGLNLNLVGYNLTYGRTQ